MSKKAIFVLFGVTGDLAKRYLISAIHCIYKSKKIKDFEVIGVGRKNIVDKGFNDYISSNLREFANCSIEDIDKKFFEKFSYFKVDFDDLNSFKKLKKNIDSKTDKDSQIIFYLAIPPGLFRTVLGNINNSNLNYKEENQKTKIVFEKPFGEDLKSARSLNNKVMEVFEENQVYRIDHYLGKEAVQNFLVLRFANSFFEPLWNNKYIDNVQITSGEKLGVENRSNYYDNAGALRDMVQNHLFQMLSLIAMEPPITLDSDSVRDEKVKVFKAIKDFKGDWNKNVVFGQYNGYQNEKGVKKNSRTETFVALKIEVDNFRWAGVPFYLRTGKKFKQKGTTVVVEFKSLPSILYNNNDSLEKNKLIIKVHPDEKIEMQFNIKALGDNLKINSVTTQFDHKEFFKANSPEAYEKLLLNIFDSDQTHFTRWDGVEESWKVVDKLVDCRDNCPIVFKYKEGEFGPRESDKLLKKDERVWHNV